MLSDKSGDIGNFSGLGAGGGSGGAFGMQRAGGGKRWLLMQGGGSQKTEIVVGAAIDWMARHQTYVSGTGDEEKALWLYGAWIRNCSDRKENRSAKYANKEKFPGVCPTVADKKVFIIDSYREGKKTGESFDLSMHKFYSRVRPLTANSLVILAFSGAGYTHKRGPYKKTIKRNLKIILEQVTRFSPVGEATITGIDKAIGDMKGTILANLSSMQKRRSIYDQALLAFALTDLAGTSRDKYLIEKAKKTLVDLLKGQTSSNAWTYSFTGDASSETTDDLSQTIWAAMALKTAKSIGILKDVCQTAGKNDKEVIQNIKTYIESCKGAKVDAPVHYNYGASTVTDDYKGLIPGDGTAKWLAPRPGRAMFALLGYAFLYGKKDRFKKMEPIVNWLNDSILQKKNGAVSDEVEKLSTSLKSSKVRTLSNYWSSTNYNAYFHYYNCLSLFQYGGKIWKDYNEKMKGLLIPKQAKGKQCSNGSWSATNFRDVILNDTLYVTAMNTLQLEVYYRYKRNKRK